MARTVTVVGAGIVGICCALYLQRQGFSVVLMDRAEPGAECSSGNAGMIQASSIFPFAMPGILRRVPRMLVDPTGPLAVEWRDALELAPWMRRFFHETASRRAEHNMQALAQLQRFARETYEPLLDADAADLVRPRGELYVYRNEAAYSGLQGKFAAYRRHGVECIELSAAALRDYEPALAPDCRWGFYVPRSQYIRDPHALCGILARRFAADGGEVVREEVLPLTRDENGSISRLQTSNGVRSVDNLVIAAGVFSKQLLAALDVLVLLTPMRGYHLMVEDNVRLNGPVIDGERSFGVIPMNKGIRLAGTAEFASLRRAPNWKRADMLLPLARKVIPSLNASILSRWMGNRPSTPDSLPVLGPLSAARNVWCAFGHGQSGLTLAAISGRVVANGLSGQPQPFSLHPYRPERFS